MAYRFTQTADELQNIMDLSQNHIAAAFSIETSYEKDDYCTYEGALYKCITATSGAFNPSEWEEVTIGDELSNIGSASSAGIELTQAEYDALEEKDPDTIYFIKDANNGHSKADASDVAYGDGTVADALDNVQVYYTCGTTDQYGQFRIRKPNPQLTPIAAMSTTNQYTARLMYNESGSDYTWVRCTSWSDSPIGAGYTIGLYVLYVPYRGNNLDPVA